MFYIYILNSIKNGRYYVGSCEDINIRLTRHNKGLVKSTKFYIPWKIVYTEEYKTLSEARKREYQIKSWKKRSEIEKLIKHLNFKEIEDPRF
ncbi:MAG: GIY-YIG nuclease family protein [Candidatus Nomurabacteria bacterium]|nr:GIY-YIG nuclease family protein [Candidatus Nomurabacteria bacterium]